jgi:hypothetical protein
MGGRSGRIATKERKEHIEGVGFGKREQTEVTEKGGIGGWQYVVLVWFLLVSLWLVMVSLGGEIDAENSAGPGFGGDGGAADRLLDDGHRLPLQYFRE